jgi:DNA excision repair protein ERCC-1
VPASAAGAGVLEVARRHEGGRLPLLKRLRGAWRFADTAALAVVDMLAGPPTSRCAIVLLQLRYHLLQPDYIGERCREAGSAWRQRVVLCVTDHGGSEEAGGPLGALSLECLRLGWQLLVAWGEVEAARYLEALRDAAGRPPTAILPAAAPDRLPDLLACVRGINSADAAALAGGLGSFAAIATATAAQLALCPGVGQVKLQRLEQAFRRPFRAQNP